MHNIIYLAEHDLFTVSLEKPIAALRKQDPKYAAVYTIVFSAKNVTHLSIVKKQNVKTNKAAKQGGAGEGRLSHIRARLLLLLIKHTLTQATSVSF